jgi:hypothetical protein
MVADDQFPWLTATPVDYDDISEDVDADGDVDVDGDVSIAMALDEMVISIAHHAPDPKSRDVLKRKRTLSKALSPPKVITLTSTNQPTSFTDCLHLSQADGGRGFPKRLKASRSEAFFRPSSPYVRPTAKRSVSMSVSCAPTDHKNINIAHTRTPSERASFTSYTVTRHVLTGYACISHSDIVTPSPLARNSRAVSEISMWTESEDDTPRDTTLQANVDDYEEKTIEDPDVATGGPRNIAIGISDHVDGVEVIVPVKEEGAGVTGESGTDGQLTCVTGLFDEDVRVSVPSSPE